MKALFFWASVAPICTFLVLLKYNGSASSSNAGYALPFIAMALVAAIFAAAIVIGFLTKTFKKSILGALIGLPLSYAVVMTFWGTVQYQNQSDMAAREREIKELVPALRSDKIEQMAQGFQKLKVVSVPVAFCAAVTKNSNYSDLFFDAETIALKKEYPFSIDEIFKMTSVTISMPLPIEEKDAILYLALKTITERNSLKSFPKWVKLWNKVHPNEKTFEIKFSYNLNDPYCPWGSTQTLATDVVETWSDAGILAWLNSNHIFSSQQQRYVLQKVKRAETLKKLVSSGVNINAKYPGESDDTQGSNSVLVDRAYTFSQLINETKNPLDIARLAETFVQLGADTTSLSGSEQTPCQIFLSTESYLDKTELKRRSTFQEKLKAFHLIKSYLCPKNS